MTTSVSAVATSSDPYRLAVLFVDSAVSARLDSTAIEVWVRVLREQCPDVARLNAACRAVAADWTSAYPPPVGAIVDHYRKAGTGASEEWAELIRQIGPVGYYGTPVYPSAAAKAALAAATGKGWRGLCEAPADRIDSIRRRFVAAWEDSQ